MVKQKKGNNLEKCLEKKYPKTWHLVAFVLKWRIIMALSFLFFSVKYCQQDAMIDDLERDVLVLKIDGIEAKSEAFYSQKELDNIPFALWRKKKQGNRYLMKFINLTGKVQFLDNAGISRLYFYNKTDAQIFKNSVDTERWHYEDSIVANYHKDTIMHFTNNFHDAANKVMIKSGYSRWRRIIDSDTMVYGMMDKPFIIKKK